MRKILVLTTVLATMSLGMSGGAFAQAPGAAPLAAVSGQAVDAVGLPVIGERVDLVYNGEIVQSTTTGAQGQWSFTNVAPGDYVVRMSINDQVAGVLVSVTPGQAVANALIVAPSAAAQSAAFLGGFGSAGGVLLGTAVAGALIATAIVVTGS